MEATRQRGGRIVLLDVNVLVALLDGNHIHHSAVIPWFEANRSRGWATCPITENGFLRTLSRPGYSEIFRSVSELRELLDEVCADGYHVFWPDSVTLRDPTISLTGVTSGHSTDFYLLALAIANGGSFATIDRHVPTAALGSPGLDAIEVIPA